MYSHGSLKSELVDILNFIEDNFHQVGSKPPSREPIFVAASLSAKTDAVTKIFRNTIDFG